MNTAKIVAGRHYSLPRPLKKWLAFFAGLLALYFFAFIFLPFVSNTLPGFRSAHDKIIEENIEAGAWFYIFVKQYSEIEPRVRDTMKYTPGQSGVK